jgi:hypothetical protein
VTTQAREAVARAFEEILARRYPGFLFAVEDVGAQSESSPRTRKIIGPLTPPEHSGPIGNGSTTAPDEDSIETGGE